VSYRATPEELLRMKQEILSLPVTFNLLAKWQTLDETSRKNLRSMVPAAALRAALGALLDA
jgi:hypothetical protein